MPHYRIALRTLRATFYTSLSNEFIAKPEESLRKKLFSACTALEKALPRNK